MFLKYQHKLIFTNYKVGETENSFRNLSPGQGGILFIIIIASGIIVGLVICTVCLTQNARIYVRVCVCVCFRIFVIVCEVLFILQPIFSALETVQYDITELNKRHNSQSRRCGWLRSLLRVPSSFPRPPSTPQRRR